LAQVYSYSRAQGLFAGVALDGSALTIDRKSNAAYYNRPGVLASEIIAGSAPLPPETAREFIGTLDKMLGIGTLSTASTMIAPSVSTSAPVGGPQATSGSLEAIPGKLTTHPMEDPSPGKEPPQ
jgi:hypothetical protein